MARVWQLTQRFSLIFVFCSFGLLARRLSSQASLAVFVDLSGCGVRVWPHERTQSCLWATEVSGLQGINDTHPWWVYPLSRRAALLYKASQSFNFTISFNGDSFGLS